MEIRQVIKVYISVVVTRISHVYDIVYVCYAQITGTPKRPPQILNPLCKSQETYFSLEAWFLCLSNVVV